jgi:hypothetical protein
MKYSEEIEIFFWGVRGERLTNREEKKHTHTHTHTHLCVCVCVCVWLRGLCAHRPRNHTLYDISTPSLCFQVTQEDPVSSPMMAGYCRNM